MSERKKQRQKKASRHGATLSQRVAKLERLTTGLPAPVETRGTEFQKGVMACIAILKDEYINRVPLYTRREGALRCATQRIEQELGVTIGQATFVSENHRELARIGVYPSLASPPKQIEHREEARI